MSTIRARFTALQIGGMLRAAMHRASNTSQSAETCAAWWRIYDRLRTAVSTETLELDTIDAGTLADDLGASGVAVFPLPDFVVFPGTPVPIHFFEPRYRAMVRDALDTHQTLSVVLDPALSTTADTYVARIILDPQNPKFHECNEANNASGPVTPIARAVVTAKVA